MRRTIGLTWIMWANDANAYLTFLLVMGIVYYVTILNCHRHLRSTPNKLSSVTRHRSVV